jgi:hypothetical protein
MDGTRWRAERDRAVAARGAAMERQAAAETSRAAEMVAGFARDARERGLRPGPLTARGHDGRGRYRTGLRGWYLTPDGRLAVGEDGHFYVLTVPSSLRGRMTGVTVPPGRPRLVVGEGARDGERIALSDLLARRLAAGDDGPR